ncbi:MAG: CPBP family intramembrane glutamic endopeptidase [Gemmatimonadota bacterium]
MRNAVLAGAVVGLAIVTVWLAASELAWPARAFTTFLVAVLPPLLVAQVGIADEVPDRVPRRALYISSAVGIWLLAFLAVAAGLGGGFSTATLGLTAAAAGPLVAWSAGVTAAGLLLMAAGRVLRVRESRILTYLLPRTAGEKLGFAALSVSAGVGEELAFRGFLIPALDIATGSLAVAVLLSSAIFGLLHAYQRSAGVLRATLLGALLAAPFVATGSLLPSMIAHTALDLLAGLWLSDWLLRR